MPPCICIFFNLFLSCLWFFWAYVFNLLDQIYFLVLGFFFCRCKWDCFLSFLIVHYWCIKMQLISEYLVCILLICWTHLPVIVGFFFLVESVGFSICSIISSTNNDSFTSSFPIWMPFISTCPIAVARTSSTMLNVVKVNILMSYFLFPWS